MGRGCWRRGMADSLLHEAKAYYVLSHATRALKWGGRSVTHAAGTDGQNFRAPVSVRLSARLSALVLPGGTEVVRCASPDCTETLPEVPTSIAQVRAAAVKAGEACATKVQDGLTTTAQTFDE